MKLWQKEIKYLAHIFMPKSIKPDPGNLKAIINMLWPKDEHMKKNWLSCKTLRSLPFHTHSKTHGVIKGFSS